MAAIAPMGRSYSRIRENAQEVSLRHAFVSTIGQRSFRIFACGPIAPVSTPRFRRSLTTLVVSSVAGVRSSLICDQFDGEE